MSNRLRRHASKHLLSVFCSIAITSSAPAIEIFDDFEDGSVTDGSPISWTTTNGSVDNGDLVIGGAGTAIKTSMAVVEPADGWSILSQARIDRSFFGLMASREGSNGWSMIDASGTVYVGSLFTVIDSVSTDLRPAQEDVMLQLDTFDDLFQVWAWRPGEPRPVAPLVESTIVLPGESVPTLWLRDPAGNPAEARFRWIQFSSEESIRSLLGVSIKSVVDTSRQLDDQGDFLFGNIGAIGEEHGAPPGLHRLITKFELPSGEASRLQQATLRIYLEEIEGTPAGPLAVFHSSSNNDLDVLTSEYEEDSYVDSFRALANPSDLGQAFYEVDVTDLILADYAADGETPVASFRLQVTDASFDAAGDNNLFRVTDSLDVLDDRNPTLVLTFVPEPSSLVCGLVCLAVSWRVFSKKRNRSSIAHLRFG